MKIKTTLALLAALSLAGSALSEPVDTELLVEMTSEQKIHLEQRLSELGFFSGECDSAYDAETRAAVESFQQANGLEVTGLADDATLQRLDSADAVSRQDYLTRFAGAYAQMTALELGATSNDVLVMQRHLKDLGYFSGEPSGSFDDATRQAVESFQMVNGLPITGVADGATLMRLMADAPITWPAFLTEMSASEGDTGLNVYVLQSRLAQMGYFTGSRTACFGELTKDAVQRFQQEVGLEATGQADAATWAAIYSRSGTADIPSDALKPGDTGDNVKAVQTRLNALGFFDNAMSGEYGYATQTAVRLFQIAAGLEATGILDAETSSRLMADNAPSMLDAAVQQRFASMLSNADASVRPRISDIATAHIGALFEGEEDDLYPGFSFVQYVCVAAGLPVTIPEDLIGMASQEVQSMDSVAAGDIVVLQSNGDNVVNMVMAIGIGDGRVVGTSESGGWAELSYMEQMDGATIYCWNGNAF